MEFKKNTITVDKFSFLEFLSIMPQNYLVFIIYLIHTHHLFEILMQLNYQNSTLLCSSTYHVHQQAFQIITKDDEFQNFNPKSCLHEFLLIVLPGAKGMLEMHYHISFLCFVYFCPLTMQY